MPVKRVDLVGRTFGRLTVQEFAGVRSGKSYWRCACACGGSKEALTGSLVDGDTKSCGCLLAETRSANGKKRGTHGLSATSEFRSWASMMDRCHNEKSAAYPKYGGRGITVCDEWRSFETFLAAMGPRPAGTTIERNDNERGYEPGNCCWATKTQQSRNRRNVKLSESAAQDIRTSLLSTADLAAQYNVTPSMIRSVRAGKTWAVNGLKLAAHEGAAMTNEADKPSVEGLKPCPFCGGKTWFNSEHDSDGDGVFYAIRCDACNARSSQHYVSHGNDCPQFRSEVRAVWNRRASEAAPAAHVNRTVAINATHWPPGETGLWVAVCPDAAAGPYPTAMRPATPEEARAMQTRVAAPAAQPAPPLSIAELRELLDVVQHALNDARNYALRGDRHE